jgi:hypothetical protein
MSWLSHPRWVVGIVFTERERERARESKREREREREIERKREREKKRERDREKESESEGERDREIERKRAKERERERERERKREVAAKKSSHPFSFSKPSVSFLSVVSSSLGRFGHSLRVRTFIRLRLQHCKRYNQSLLFIQTVEAKSN